MVLSVHKGPNVRVWYHLRPKHTPYTYMDPLGLLSAIVIQLQLIMETLHGLIEQNCRNYGSLVYMGSCRISISTVACHFLLLLFREPAPYVRADRGHEIAAQLLEVSVPSDLSAEPKALGLWMCATRFISGQHPPRGCTCPKGPSNQVWSIYCKP